MIHDTRPAKDKNILEVRALTRDDLTRLREPRRMNTVQKLRDPHHMLARLLAAGIRLPQAAAASGYSYNSAARLKLDPAFTELVEHYRQIVTAEWAQSVDSFYEMATSNMLKAERQIAEHLDQADEAGELLPIKQLHAISRDAADRFGYQKRQTQVNVNVDFAAKLDRARGRSLKVIEGAVAPAGPQASPPPQRQTVAAAPSPRLARRA